MTNYILLSVLWLKDPQQPHPCIQYNVKRVDRSRWWGEVPYHCINRQPPWTPGNTTESIVDDPCNGLESEYYWAG